MDTFHSMILDVSSPLTLLLYSWAALDTRLWFSLWIGILLSGKFEKHANDFDMRLDGRFPVENLEHEDLRMFCAVLFGF